MRKKVLLLGASGMLGSGVYSVLKDKYDLVLIFRRLKSAELLEKAYGGTMNHQVMEFELSFMYDDFFNKKGFPGPYINGFLSKIGDVDYVINTIGIIIPFSLKNPAMTFFVNSAFPHILAEIFSEKLIHITTDCVFNGKEGFPYNEKSPHAPIDIYGLSKSLGEPQNALTLRTSIIGKEIENFGNLLSWFLQQEGKEIKGFAEHYWNGITTKEFGKICDRIIQNPENYPKRGIYHIFSNTVTKYEMLKKFKEKFNINCVIKEDHENELNRTLSTIYDFNSKLKIPSFDEMLKEL